MLWDVLLRSVLLLAVVVVILLVLLSTLRCGGRLLPNLPPKPPMLARIRLCSTRRSCRFLARLPHVYVGIGYLDSCTSGAGACTSLQMTTGTSGKNDDVTKSRSRSKEASFAQEAARHAFTSPRIFPPSIASNLSVTSRSRAVSTGEPESRTRTRQPTPRARLFSGNALHGMCTHEACSQQALAAVRPACQQESRPLSFLLLHTHRFLLQRPTPSGLPAYVRPLPLLMTPFGTRTTGCRSSRNKLPYEREISGHLLVCLAGDALLVVGVLKGRPRENGREAEDVAEELERVGHRADRVGAPRLQHPARCDAMRRVATHEGVAFPFTVYRFL